MPETHAANDDAQPTCAEQPFCDRFRQFMDHSEMRLASDVYYSVNADSVTFEEAKGTISAELNLASSSDGSIAQSLMLTLTVYKDGILRMLIEEPEVKRFRISQEELPVVDDQLDPLDLAGKYEWAVDGSGLKYLKL